MVAGYARAMAAETGSTLMKNRIETRLFQKHVRGTDILDVGVGTGRASLPLARTGKNVTGVDSSQAMLDKCRELAGATSIRLLLGDVANLPFPDASFDTVMGLNTLAHFPHWKEIMREWRRTVRPGGELIFDVHSLDHDIAFGRASGHDEQYGIDHFAAADVRSFHLRLRVEDLVNYASEIGLRVRVVVPYGALFGSAGIHRFLQGTLLDGHSWDRLLSWVGSDDQLFDFFSFIEEELVSRMPSSATGRYVAIFDALEDCDANQAWLQANRRLEEQFAEGLSIGVLARSPADAARLKEDLNEFLAHEPSRFALARMLLANRTWNWSVPLQEWIDDAYRPQLEHILTLGALNDAALGILASLSGSRPIAQALEYKGLPLQRMLAYDLMTDILDEGCHAFDASLSRAD